MAKRYGSRQTIKTHTPPGLLDDFELLDYLGMFAPMLPTALLGDPFSPTEAMAGEEELLAKYRSGEIASVFPQPYRLGGPQFGRYLQMPEKLDITDNFYEGAYIDTKGSKPKLRVARQITENLPDFSQAPGSRIYTNLYKNPPITIRPEMMPDDGRFIISNEFRGGEKIPGLFEKSGDHIYTLETHFDSPVALARDEGKVRSALKAMEKGTRVPGEPYMRPRSAGKIELGEMVGEISNRGKSKPIFDRLLMYLPKNYVRGF